MKKYPLVARLAHRLCSHRKTERFGVRLVRNQLGLSEEQVLLENCDKAHRALHCEVIDCGAIPTPNTIETT
ncbi:MAG: hypothetical protein ACLQIK_12300 [Mycobacterium sp.]|uniref:hypothetical protein n=1 Tax=Mycobacterium sp. TaxID=1785 RepID=UPI003F96E37B